MEMFLCKVRLAGGKYTLEDISLTLDLIPHRVLTDSQTGKEIECTKLYSGNLEININKIRDFCGEHMYKHVFADKTLVVETGEVLGTFTAEITDVTLTMHKIVIGIRGEFTWDKSHATPHLVKEGK